MPEFLSKEEEKRMLVQRILPMPYAGSNGSGLLLFEFCRNHGSTYCKQFDERGYTKEYAQFETDKVIEEAVKLLSDDLLLEFAKVNESALSAYSGFKGRHYSYDPRIKKLIIGSRWDEDRKYVETLISSMTECVKCVLEAVIEVSKAGVYDSYWAIFTLAKEKGLGKGWWKVLSKLQLGELIGEDYGHMNMKPELIPLIEEILGSV